MLKAYFDDSGTHNGSTVTAVGGFVAKAEEWDAFDRDWAEMLEVEKIGWFHMTDCGGQYGEFAGWPKERCDVLIKRAISIVKEHPLHGVAAGMLVKDKKPTIPIQALDMCFIQCISALLYRAEQLGDRVEIFMEDHPGRKKHLLQYLGFLDRHSQRGELVEKIHSVRNREHSPLQAADLLAYEMYKEVLNSYTVKESRPIRRSMLSLMETQRMFCVQLGLNWARSGFRWSPDKDEEIRSNGAGSSGLV